MGPLPAAVRHDPGRLSHERRTVLEAVRDAASPVPLAALVDATGRHENTVREHLSALTRLGLVVRTRRDPSGRGRPAWLYAAGEVRMPPGPSEYADLAALLAETLARTSPDVASVAVEAGRRWGSRLAAAQPMAEADPVTARQRVVAMLRRYGFEPHPVTGGPLVRLTRCPILDTARAHPSVVCHVHQGIVAGALEAFGGTADGLGLVAFAEPGACLLSLPR